MRERYYDDKRENARKIPVGKFRKVFTVAEMSAKHHEIARLLVLGKKNTEVAKLLGVTPMLVSNVRNSPQVIEQMSFLSAKKDAAVVEISEQIAEALPKCVKFLADTIEDENISEHLRSKNAFGLLASGGYGPSKSVNIKGVHAILSADDIRDIRNQAAEIGIASGIVLESEEA